MKRAFHKMHGLGNDFVIVDAREEPFEITPGLARAIADRRTGVGCDQLIVLEQSDRADLRMRIWNSDGGEVESCGNATRCVVQLTGARTIDSDGGLLQGENLGDEVEVAIGEPRFMWDEIPISYPIDTAALPLAWDGLERPQAVNVGNPHLIFFVDDLNSVGLETLGPRIENDAAFPERINVNVAQIGNDGIHLKTWERGAGLTPACGTGACATAVAAIRSKRSLSPVKVTMPGGSLTIAWEQGQPIRMRGTASHVFEGELELEALR
ncbi:MAG TPA: diaminopimelate epimerase [Sphingomicrobium sp.]|nr:diaminopimelate epimerase [Sphingomicrobium sp.]